MLARLLASKKSPYIPNWDYRHNLSVDLGVCQLTLQLPKGNISDCPEQLAGSRLNIFDRQIYVTDENLPTHQRSGMASHSLISSAWELFGAPFGSKSLGAMFFVLAIKRVDDLPEKCSCLNPSNFLSVVDRDMYYAYGPGNQGIVSSVAPVDWKISSDDQWVHYKVAPPLESLSYESQKEFRVVYLTPIDDFHFIKVEFVVSGFQPTHLSEKHFRGCVYQILNTLSVENRSQKVRLTDLGRPRNPFFWEDHQIGKKKLKDGTYTRVVDPVGTPPPQYKVDK